MRYFAMIDGERRGPYELSQLPAAGVGPDTYVWCKDMEDWQKAEEVADICRYYRQHIFGIMHPAPAPAPRAATPEPPAQDPGDGTPMLRMMKPVFDDETQVPDTPPTSTMILAVFLTLFCFPITGAVGIYYSLMARKSWEEATRSESAKGKALYSDKEREEYRRLSYDYNRKAKMWIGITFFMGVMMYAMLGRTFL